MMMISMDKKYRTRDGHEVRIYALDGGGMHSVHGSVLMNDGWRSCTWLFDGRITCADSCGDLIEVKPRIKRTVWVNVYANGFSGWGDRETADANSSFTRLACIKVEIDCEEGEGL